MSLLDHFVCTEDQRWRNLQTKCSSGLEVDRKLEFGWLQNRKVGGLSRIFDNVSFRALSPAQRTSIAP